MHSALRGRQSLLHSLQFVGIHCHKNSVYNMKTPYRMTDICSYSEQLVGIFDIFSLAPPAVTNVSHHTSSVLIEVQICTAFVFTGSLDRLCNVKLNRTLNILLITTSCQYGCLKESCLLLAFIDIIICEWKILYYCISYFPFKCLLVINTDKVGDVFTSYYGTLAHY